MSDNYEFIVPRGYHLWSEDKRDNFIYRFESGDDVSSYTSKAYQAYLTAAFPPDGGNNSVTHDAMAAMTEWELAYTADALIDASLKISDPDATYHATCRPPWLASNPAKVQTCDWCKYIGI